MSRGGHAARANDWPPFPLLAWETYWWEGQDILPTWAGFAAINVLAVERDSIAYVGFVLECAWEEEHGLGVLTHLDRIATLGDADDADTEWVALPTGDGTSSRRRPEVMSGWPGEE